MTRAAACCIALAACVASTAAAAQQPAFKAGEIAEAFVAVCVSAFPELDRVRAHAVEAKWLDVTDPSTGILLDRMPPDMQRFYGSMRSDSAQKQWIVTAPFPHAVVISDAAAGEWGACLLTATADDPDAVVTTVAENLTASRTGEEIDKEHSLTQRSSLWSFTKDGIDGLLGAMHYSDHLELAIVTDYRKAR